MLRSTMTILQKFIVLIKSDKIHFSVFEFNNLIVIGLAVVMLSIGIFYSLFLSNTLRYFDESLYVDLARNLLDKNMYSSNDSIHTVVRPPGYSFFLYVIFSLSGKIIHVRIIQYFLLAGSLILIYLILRIWYDRLAGVIACIFVLCYPVLFYTAGTLYPQTLTSFLLLLICYLVFRPQSDSFHWMLGGLIYGYLLLTTPIFLLIVPIFLILPWAFKIRYPLRAALIFLVGAPLIVTPWILRNYKQFDRFIPFSTNSGLMLILGNSEYAKSNLGPNTDITKYKENAKKLGLSEVETDIYYRLEAKKWILDNKLDAAKLFILKFLNNFNFRNKLATHSESKLWRDIIMFMTYYPSLLLAILCLFRDKDWKTRPYEFFSMACYIVIGAGYAIFFTRIRYRLPVDWLMISLAAIYAASLLERYMEKINQE